MSVELGRIASFFSVALLAGLLPAQEKPKTVDELRKENAALRQQVKTLRAQLDALKKKAKNPTTSPVIGDIQYQPAHYVSYNIFNMRKPRETFVNITDHDRSRPASKLTPPTAGSWSRCWLCRHSSK